MQTRFIAEPPIFILNYGVNIMPDEKKELEAEIMEEFEWALKDPNEENSPAG